MNFSDSCIILAAGDQTRWNIGNAELPRTKQLLNPRGEILLEHAGYVEVGGNLGLQPLTEVTIEATAHVAPHQL